jgi:hypothetical protein
MAQKTVVLGAARKDAGVPQGIPAELVTNEENQVVLHFEEPDITP